MTAGKAWLTLITAITTWEIYALRTNPDRLLSRGMDAARASHPATNAACTVAVIITAAHLLRCIPSAVDPFRLAHS